MKIITAFITLLVFSSAAQQNPIIPQPKKIEFKSGNFVFSRCIDWQFDAGNEQLQWAMRPLFDRLQHAAGIKREDAINCKMRSTFNVILDKNFDKAEGYTLNVQPLSIEIRAQQPAGVFYAIQSLIQLLPVEIESPELVTNTAWKVPAVFIEDDPTFGYRGLMLDVARHFMTVDSVKRFIDLIAKQKNNRFHWHLTDSQGWRFESKKYPKLTEIGAYRKGTPLNTTYDYNSRPGDTLYGGYYTKDEMRDVVQYAKERFVTIIPEIEMPAHSKSALASYPELACLDSTGKPFPYPQQIQDEFCTKDETFTFLENVLSEVMEIFPSEYIHIGGDEAEKNNWKKCPHDIQRMKQEGLKGVDELQSYFIKRIATFVNGKGRKIIGWDEIMQGGLAPGATVMSWTGIENGIIAAKDRHYVVMTPGNYCYFDHYQSDAPSEPIAWGGYTPLPKVYSYYPVPAELNKQQAKYIWGTQGNLWREFIPTASKAEYMVFPRSIALAEVAWSDSSQKNYDDFVRRLIPYFKRLDYRDVNYSKHLFELRLKDSISGDGNVMIKLSGAGSNNKIYYTLDGEEPTANSAVYEKPVEITKSGKIRAAVIMEGKIVDELYRDFVMHKGVAKKGSLLYPPSPYYNRGGDGAWHNGSIGSDGRYSDEEWLGWSGKDFNGTIDFQKPIEVSSLKTRFFHKPSSWIWMPEKLMVQVSNDGQNYETVSEKEIQPPADEKAYPVSLSWKPIKARFIRIIAVPKQQIPQGFGGAGEKAWLFVDEMILE